MNALLPLVALLTFSQLSFPQVASAAPIAQTASEEDIREAAFRYMMAPYMTAAELKLKKPYPWTGAPAPGEQRQKQNLDFKVFYLALSENVEPATYKDPSAALVKRFARHIPPVKKFSESVVVKTRMSVDPSGYWVHDRQTKQAGIIYTVGKVTWLNKNKARLSGNFYIGALNGFGYSLLMQRAGKTWKVTDIQPLPKRRKTVKGLHTG